MNEKQEVITQAAKIRGGIALDRLDTIGRNGGITTYWRRADRRDVHCAIWHPTQAGARLAGPQ